MKRRSIYLLIFSLAVVVSIVIVSCSRKPTSKRTKGNVVTLACWGTPHEITALKEGLKRFEKRHPGVKVKLIRILVGGYSRKILTMFAGKCSPDVMYLLEQDVSGFSSRGVLLDLSFRIEKSGQINPQGFFSSFDRIAKYKGMYYALPLYISPFVLYYNKDLFDAEGLSYPDETWTWEDFLKAAKRLTKDLDRDGKIDTYGFICSSDPYRFGSFILQNEGKLGEERGGFLNLSTLNETIEAIEFIHDLTYRYKVSPIPSVKSTFGGDSGRMFMLGKTAMHSCGVWTGIDFKRLISNFNWDISVLPHHKKRGTILLGTFLGISKESQVPDLAWELALFLINEGIDKRCMPPLKSNKVQKEYFNSVGLGDKNYQAFLDSMRYGEFLPPIISGDVSKVYGTEMGLMWLGKEPVRDALERMIKKFGELEDK